MMNTAVGWPKLKTEPSATRKPNNNANDWNNNGLPNDKQPSDAAPNEWLREDLPSKPNDNSGPQPAAPTQRIEFFNHPTAPAAPMAMTLSYNP